MIDAIQEKFDKVADLWDSLVVHPCLSFYFLPISQMGLTDELYVGPILLVGCINLAAITADNLYGGLKKKIKENNGKEDD